MCNNQSLITDQFLKSKGFSLNDSQYEYKLSQGFTLILTKQGQLYLPRVESSNGIALTDIVEEYQNFLITNHIQEARFKGLKYQNELDEFLKYVNQKNFK